MSLIKIGIKYSDQELSHAVARALSEKLSGYVFEILPACESTNEDVTLNSGDTSSDFAAILDDNDSFTDVNELAALVIEKTPEAMRKKTSVALEDVSLIPVTGISGGLGTSSVAYGIADELSLYYGKRVFLISLEPFPGKLYQGNASELRRLLFKIRNGSMDKQQLSSFRSETVNGIGLLNYGNGLNPLSETSKQDIIKLIGEIRKLANCECIILDIPAGRINLAFDLIEYSRSIVVIKEFEKPAYTGGRFSLETEEESFDQRGQFNKSNQLSQLSQLNQSKADSIIKLLSEEAETTDCRIIDMVNSYDADSFRGGSIRIDGEFGVIIKETVRRMME